MNKLRVLFAIGEMAGDGSQRQLVGILQRLDRARFAPQLYVVSPGGVLRSEVPADVPVHVFHERTGGRWQGNSWWQRIRAFAARSHDLAAVLAEQRIDVLYDRTYHMTLTAAGATRRRATPRLSVIVTDPRQDFETNRERYRGLKWWLLRRAYHTADRVVAVSEGVRRAAVGCYGLPAAKTVTLYNFFDVERIDRLMHEPLPPAEVKQPGRFEIVTVGRLHTQKGYRYLFEAVRELVQRRGLNQIQVRILGTGPLEGELRAYIAHSGLEQHVRLAGFRLNPLPYVRQADLFCLPSLYEGMPNALVEAMLCGVPVLAADCPSGPREILLDGELGRLVPPANSLALADAIEDAVRRHDAWQSLVPAARRHIEKQFSPAAGMQRLEDLLLSLV